MPAKRESSSIEIHSHSSNEERPPRYDDDDVHGLGHAVEAELMDQTPGPGPPAYEDVVYAWGAHELAQLNGAGQGSAATRDPTALSARDRTEMDQRGTRLFRFSLVCFVIDLIVIFVGFAVGRSVGTFTISNVGALIIFGLGVANFWRTDHTRSSQFALLYFFLLYFTMVAGVFLSGYYAITIKARVKSYCAVHPEYARCREQSLGDLVTAGLVATVVGTFAWLVFFSVFIRATFMYIGATERAARFDRRDQGVAMARHPTLMRWMLFFSRCLPHYRRWGRCVNVCLGAICGTCSQSARGFFRSIDAAWLCGLLCCMTFCVSLVMCFVPGPLGPLFCFIADFMFQLFTIFTDA